MEPFRQPKLIDTNACVLRQILKDPLQTQHWENAVLMLGLIGYAPDAPFIAHFAFASYAKGQVTPSMPVPPTVFRAKISALLALGFMCNRAPESSRGAVRKQMVEAMDRLHSGKKMNLDWRSPYHSDQVDQVVEMLDSLLSGFGVSGDPDLRNRLGEFEKHHLATLEKVKTEEITYHGFGSVIARRQLMDLVERAQTAIRESSIVQERGLAALYPGNTVAAN